LGPKLTNYQISKKMHCSENTVALWLQRYKETGDVLDKEGQGRKPVTNERQDEMIHKAMLADPNQSSTEISEKMKRKGVAISPPSVRRRLIAQGWRYGKPMTKPLLSKMCIAKRGWNGPRKMKKSNWDNAIFTDETTFQLCRNLNRAWIHPTSGITYRTVKHPPKIHAWGCFSPLL